MTIEELIREFHAAAGLEQTDVDGGVWKFSADGMVFGVTSDAAGEKVYLFGEIGNPPPESENTFRKAILEANYFFRGTGGATLSLNPETGKYTLMASERLAGMDARAFFSMVEKFVNTIAAWRKIAESTTASDEEPSGESSFDESSYGTSAMNFMRA